MCGDGKISVQDTNPSLQPSAYTNYLTLAPVVRYMFPNNFKANGTFIFTGKLTLESEEVTVLQNSGNYTTSRTVSHPKGPKSLPVPLWKPQISHLPILPKFYHNCLFNTLEVRRQILLTFNTHTQYMKIQVFWDIVQHRLLNLTFPSTSLWVHHILHQTSCTTVKC